MASPQREHGFTGIANEILEATQMYKFTLNELKIIMCVWRYTYGFNRKSHELSLGFFEKHTGLNRARINDSLKKLVDSNVLKKVEQGNAKKTNSYSFNKYYNTWEKERYSSFNSNDLNTSVQDDTSTQNDTNTSVQDDTSTSVQDDTQERKYKESIKEIQAQEIFDYYISKNIIRHKRFDSDMKRKTKAQIKKYGIEEIKTAINNYSIVFHSDDYWFTQKYSLLDILRDKDIRQFGSEADPLFNFARDKSKVKQKQTNEEKERNNLIERLNNLKGMLELPDDYYEMTGETINREEIQREVELIEQQL